MAERHVPLAQLHADAAADRRAGASGARRLRPRGGGEKIGIIDDGLDQTHPFFDPTGFAYPAGFPRGNTGYTTPKVIVAKSLRAGHADVEVRATRRSIRSLGSCDECRGNRRRRPRHDRHCRRRVHESGVAPSAYIGNYKVLTVPTDGFGLDGNSPEIAKASRRRSRTAWT